MAEEADDLVLPPLRAMRAETAGGRPMTHVAQLNIGRFRHPTDDPRMSAFMNNLDRVNALAERSDGFVWRLKDESNNATAIRPAGDPTTAVNLTVWVKRQSARAFCLGHGSQAVLQSQGRVVREAGQAALRHVDDPGRTHPGP